jgi:hypothetical protein
LNLQSNDRALQKLRDLAGYKVAKSIILPSDNKIGIKKQIIWNLRQDIDVSEREEASRLIDRSKKVGTLKEEISTTTISKSSSPSSFPLSSRNAVGAYLSLS